VAKLDAQSKMNDMAVVGNSADADLPKTGDTRVGLFEINAGKYSACARFTAVQRYNHAERRRTAQLNSSE
jgi:hypothetical protein